MALALDKGAGYAGEMEALQDAIGTGSVDQAEMLGRLIRRVADLEAAVAANARERRELHNQLVELRGNVRLQSTEDRVALKALPSCQWECLGTGPESDHPRFLEVLK